MRKIAFMALIGIGFVILVNFFDFLPNKEKTPEVMHQYNVFQKANDLERVKILDESLERVESLESVVSEVYYEVKYPKNTLGRALLGVYLYEVNDEGKSVAMLYERGLYIKIWPLAKEPDYEEEVNYFRSLKEQGELQSDSVPDVMEINGRKGFGVGAGYNKGEHNSNEPRPGVITWYENGAQYQVYGTGINLQELKIIAESMSSL